MDINEEKEDCLVDSTKWDEMNVAELEKQKNIITNRLAYITNINHGMEGATYERAIYLMQNTLQQLDKLINYKLNNDRHSHSLIL